MSYAICQSCGKEVHWRAQRGTRLSSHRCDCGGELKSKTAGTASANTGKHFQSCDYCGRRRLETKMVTLIEPTWFIEKQLDPGARVCRWHELAQAGGGSYYHDPATDRFVEIGKLLAGNAP